MAKSIKELLKDKVAATKKRLEDLERKKLPLPKLKWESKTIGKDASF